MPLFHMPLIDKIISLVLNILLISIPEGLFMVIFSLILMHRYSSLTFTKQNVIKILIPTSIAAISTSTLRIYFEMDMTYAPFLAIISLILSVIFTYKIRHFKDILKCFFGVISAFIVMALAQLSYLPFITYGTNIKLEEIHDFRLVTLILSLPERCIEGSILLYLFSKKFSFLGMNILKTITRKKPIAIAFTIICILNLLFLYSMSVSIVFNRALLSLPSMIQVIIIATVVCFPIINITAFVSIIKIFTYYEISKKKNIYDETRILHLVVNNLIDERNYSEIEGHLKSFETHVRSI